MKYSLRALATGSVVAATLAVTSVALPLNSAFACSQKPTKPTTPAPVVEVTCNGLTVVNIDRTHFDFTAHANVQNATITSYVFTVTNSKGQTVDTATITTKDMTAVYHFNQNDADTYTVSVVIKTDHGDTKASDCTKQVTVQPAPAPVFTCDSLDVQLGANRAITAKVNLTASNGATLKDITYDFGDNSTPLVTNNTSVSYAYAKDGTYNVTATLRFNVGNDVKSVSCNKQITISTPVTPQVQATTTTPAKSLPNTGPGDIAELFVGTSAFGGVGHYLISRRKR